MQNANRDITVLTAWHPVEHRLTTPLPCECNSPNSSSHVSQSYAKIRAAGRVRVIRIMNNPIVLLFDVKTETKVGKTGYDAGR